MRLANLRKHHIVLILPLMIVLVACEPDLPDCTPLTIIGSGKQCGVARDLDSFEEFWHHVGTDNNRAIALMVLQGRLMLVPANTKAQLVGTDTRSSGLIKIRIIEGKYSGETGFLKKGEFRWDVK